MRLSPILVAIAFLAACGDDGGGGGASKKEAPKKNAKDKKKTKEKPKKIEVVTYVSTLEKVVPPDEAPTIRRRLKDRDFMPDLTGTENRNPFQSFTLPQMAAGTQPTTGPGPAPKPTDLCARNKLKASSYAIKDLALIGIVRRGSQYFAMFRDPKKVGHVVERGNCLGREKALVTAIGDDLVTTERLPEMVPGGPEPVPVTESIPLFKEEITADSFDQEEVIPPEPAPEGTQPAPPPTAPENPKP
jgi:hypothetical protein